MLSETKDCKQDAGIFIPVVDRNRCEGKATAYAFVLIRSLPPEPCPKTSVPG